MNNPSNPHQDNSQATILLLEDAVSAGECLRDKIVAEGYRCVSVTSLDQVLESWVIDLLVVNTEQLPWQSIEDLRYEADCYLPVLFICNEAEEALIDQCAEAEIDNIISRPVNIRLLMLNIRSMLRLRQLCQREHQQKTQLLDYWQMVDLENEVAAKVFNNILKADFFETDAVEVMMSQMALFEGDLVLVARTPDNQLYLLLGDFAGQGLSASIVATPTAEIFYGMSKKGFAIADITREINTRLCKMLPSNMFLAATIVALSPESKGLSLITCGLPDHFLINPVTKVCSVIRSVNIPLGIEQVFEFEEQNLSVTGCESLYLLTDGVFEAESLQGEAFGVDRIIDAIGSASGNLGLLQERLNAHTQGANQKENLAYIRLCCDVERVPWGRCEDKPVSRYVEALRWKSMMEFDISTLRAINPVPIMVNALMDIQGLQEHRQAIFMIISELFANALDHGLLELDSNIKETSEGFMQFYNLKEERLQHVTRGKVRFSFDHQPMDLGGRLTIKVCDSGEGFDWHRHCSELDVNEGYSGRGLKLVEALCSRLVYQGRGNRAKAVFDWH